MNAPKEVQATSPVKARVRAGIPRNLSPTWLAYCMVLVLAVAGQLVQPGYLLPGHLVAILNLSAVLGIVAAGQTVAILFGGIDLSVGAVVSFAEIQTMQWTHASNGRLYMVLVVILVGALIGAVNGMGVYVLRINSLIMTLGTAAVVNGLLLVVNNGSAGGNPSPVLARAMTSSWHGVQGPLTVWIVVGALTIVLLQKTAFGRTIYAYGTNQRAARLAGLSEMRTTLGVFMTSSMLAAIAGVVLAGYTGTGYFGIGEQYNIPSIAAFVIGGGSILGGRGSYVGTIAGAMILGILDSLLTLANIAAAGREIVEGLAILVILLIYGRERRLRQ